ncbi:hypothetical protein NKH77_01055 [Streptomyces sp. M19]
MPGRAGRRSPLIESWSTTATPRVGSSRLSVAWTTAEEVSDMPQAATIASGRRPWGRGAPRRRGRSR